MVTQADLQVKNLGERRIPSPLGLSTEEGDSIADYTPDDARVALNIEARDSTSLDCRLMFEKAGPRRFIFFDPEKTRAGIVTCGGLCPGINSVIRSIVLELYHKYGVREILGFQYGYEGLNPKIGLAPVHLTPPDVSSIHKQGGSVLGTSRGRQPLEVMVDTLERHGVNILFTIGGDGTLRGAHAIYEEITRRGAQIAVVGIPKSIDNDVAFVDKTFGFETAVEQARAAIDAAHTEAISARNGIGLVKLMGRDAGFIAAMATLASREVNFCLVPEVRFDLHGQKGFLAALEKRLRARGHALVVVAEGCGKMLATGEPERDASGNLSYASPSLDVGPRLKEAILHHFASVGLNVHLKYIDPSYMLRGVPANSTDSIFCDHLARNAVHAGMAGKTDIVIGRWHRVFTHIPLSIATVEQKRINPDGEVWLAVTETTGQPLMLNDPPPAAPQSR